MTRNQRDVVVAQWPETASRTTLICRDQSDVTDPIGGPPDVYRRCADQIDAQLVQWVDELELAIE